MGGITAHTRRGRGREGGGGEEGRCWGGQAPSVAALPPASRWAGQREGCSAHTSPGTRGIPGDLPGHARLQGPTQTRTHCAGWLAAGPRSVQLRPAQSSRVPRVWEPGTASLAAASSGAAYVGHRAPKATPAQGWHMGVRAPARLGQGWWEMAHHPPPPPMAAPVLGQGRAGLCPWGCRTARW